jgi:hypothetical protein
VKVTAIRGGGTQITMSVESSQCKATFSTDVRTANGKAMLEKKVGDVYDPNMFVAWLP